MSVMMWRVLDHQPCRTFDEYLRDGGGRGLFAARALGRSGTREEVSASGLRGRGGGGFPTGVKWENVVANADGRPSAVVVNGAEGEPGTFKDRAIIRRNPFRVLEGAVIAANAVGAGSILIGLNVRFSLERRRLAHAVQAAHSAGWLEGITVRFVDGPDAYLFGEETALLEVASGRPPLPRIAPPFRRGLTTPGGNEAPAVVNNIETIANLGKILANGADWFRSVGTEKSPGTVVCTVSGCTQRAGIGEVALGTSLLDVVNELGGGARPGRRLTAVFPGIANGVLTAEALETPLSYEAMSAAGSGLGTCGFLVLDDSQDIVAVTAGISQFLAVESCGQCEPCKRDGLELAAQLSLLGRSEGDGGTEAAVHDRLRTVADGARCSLAAQQQRVVGSVLVSFPDAVARHISKAAEPVAPALIAPLISFVAGEALSDETFAQKQPDWSHDDVDSGAFPAARGEDLLRDLERRRADDSEDDPFGEDLVEPPPPQLSGSSRPLKPKPLTRRWQRAQDRLLFDLIDFDAAIEVAERAQPELWDTVAGGIRAHVKVAERLLYPMARRVGGETGEALTSAAEVHQQRVLALLDAAGPVGPTEDERHELCAELEAELEVEEDHILPLLRTAMSDDDVEAFASALLEADFAFDPAHHSGQ